ncbi:MAG: esterase family protein [Acidobacteria bacterium]|nr:esterase family protein [Acidobacteriota bacterium]
MRNYLSSTVLLLFVLALSVTAHSQTQVKGVNLSENVQTFKLDSKLMQREMPYRVILPPDYRSSNENTFYPAIYLLHGLTGHYDNWSENTSLAAYSAKHNFVIIMPEGDNGWYTDSVSVGKDKYESYIIKELIPQIESKFRVKKERSARAIAGLSMGGYGGLKFGVKYPGEFVLAGSFSGALRAAQWTEKDLTGGFRPLLDSINSIFGTAGSEARKQNDIFSLVESASAEDLKKLPFLYLDCGTEDFLITQSQDFAALLLKKKVPHEFRQLPGIHNWKFWDAQIFEFLEVADKFVK